MKKSKKNPSLSPPLRKHPSQEVVATPKLTKAIQESRNPLLRVLPLHAATSSRLLGATFAARRLVQNGARFNRLAAVPRLLVDETLAQGGRDCYGVEVLIAVLGLKKNKDDADVEVTKSNR